MNRMQFSLIPMRDRHWFLFDRSVDPGTLDHVFTMRRLPDALDKLTELMAQRRTGTPKRHVIWVRAKPVPLRTGDAGTGVWVGRDPKYNAVVVARVPYEQIIETITPHLYMLEQP